MHAARKLEKILIVRLTEQDEDGLRLLASRFDLSFSEIARRALRVGTKFLNEIDFPGSASVRDTKGSSGKRDARD
jgi:hypothetical protein